MDDDGDGAPGDTNTDPVPGQLDITVTPKNDKPTDIFFYDHARMALDPNNTVRIGRVDSSFKGDQALFVIKITDEIRSIDSNPANARDGQGHYSYAFDQSNERQDAWRWLEIVTETIGGVTRHVIKIKTDAGLLMQARKEAYADFMGDEVHARDVTDATITDILNNQEGVVTIGQGQAARSINLNDIRPLTPKPNGADYSFRLIATDNPHAKNGNDATQTYSEDFTIPVRDFDFDWDLTNNNGPDGVLIDDAREVTYFADDYDHDPSPTEMVDGKLRPDAVDSFVIQAVRNGVNAPVTIRVLKDVLERDDEFVTVDRDVITLHVHRGATAADMMNVLLSGTMAATDDPVTDGRATANDAAAIAALLGENFANAQAVRGNAALQAQFGNMVNDISAQQVGSFTIFPALDYNVAANDGWEFSVGDVQDTEFGTIEVRQGGARNVFTVHFTPKPDQPDLIRLNEGETHRLQFTLPITVTKDRGTIHERVSTSNAVVTVIFRGVNETPELTIHHLDGVVHEDTAERNNLQADGAWRVSDSDNADYVHSVWGAAAGSDIIRLDGITLNAGTKGLEGQQTITGKYGTLTVNADGSWSYLAVQDKIERLNNGETDYDVFHIRVRDSGSRNSDSDVQTISIALKGTNDDPIFTFVPDDNFHTRDAAGRRVDTNAAQRDETRSTFQKVTPGTNVLVTQIVPISTILLLAGTHAAAADANNRVSGTWTARDDDDDAVVAVYNGTTRGGQLRMNADNDSTRGDNPAGGKTLDGDPVPSQVMVG